MTQVLEPGAGAQQAKAMNLIAQRQLRTKVFAESVNYIGEAGWYMLLDLYVASTAGKYVSVSSACWASFSPPTTALRHLEQLSRDGLVESSSDSKDARRRMVKLTRRGKELMANYLDAI